jgi:hypothetical protein
MLEIVLSLAKHVGNLSECTTYSARIPSEVNYFAFTGQFEHRHFF